MKVSFCTDIEIKKIGFKAIGKNVLISRFAKFYNAKNIEIGNNVRIDDFCILSCSGHLVIRNYIHIGAYSSIIGAGDVFIDDFASVSGRVSIYSSSDNYIGLGMANPTIPDQFRIVENGSVKLMKHSLIGASAVILPETTLEEGTVIGALSLARGTYKSFTVYSGNPAKELGKRIKARIKQYEKYFTNEE